MALFGKMVYNTIQKQGKGVCCGILLSVRRGGALVGAAGQIPEARIRAWGLCQCRPCKVEAGQGSDLSGTGRGQRAQNLLGWQSRRGLRLLQVKSD